MVQVGDKVIDYNEDFRLFMATRNPTPLIPPDAVSVVTEVNFTTTRAGLRGQVTHLSHAQTQSRPTWCITLQPLAVFLRLEKSLLFLSFDSDLRSCSVWVNADVMLVLVGCRPPVCRCLIACMLVCASAASVDHPAGEARVGE